MRLVLTVLVVSFASALLPVVNAEAYLAWVARRDDLQVLLLAGVAAVGQMIGKLLWYLAGTRTVRLAWVRRRLAKYQREEVLARWQAYTRGRPVATGLLLFVSAFVGLPPFLVISAIAGLLGVGLPLFVVVGLVGRFLRFWLLLELVSYSWLLL